MFASSYALSRPAASRRLSSRRVGLTERASALARPRRENRSAGCDRKCSSSVRLIREEMIESSTVAVTSVPSVEPACSKKGTIVPNKKTELPVLLKLGSPVCPRRPPLATQLPVLGLWLSDPGFLRVWPHHTAWRVRQVLWRICQ